MKIRIKAVSLLLAATLSLTGCSTIDGLLGKNSEGDELQVVIKEIKLPKSIEFPAIPNDISSQIGENYLLIEDNKIVGVSEEPAEIRFDLRVGKYYIADNVLDKDLIFEEDYINSWAGRADLQNKAGEQLNYDFFFDELDIPSVQIQSESWIAYQQHNGKKWVTVYYKLLDEEDETGIKPTWQFQEFRKLFTQQFIHQQFLNLLGVTFGSSLIGYPESYKDSNDNLVDSIDGKDVLYYDYSLRTYTDYQGNPIYEFPSNLTFTSIYIPGTYIQENSFFFVNEDVTEMYRVTDLKGNTIFLNTRIIGSEEMPENYKQVLTEEEFSEWLFEQGDYAIDIVTQILRVQTIMDSTPVQANTGLGFFHPDEILMYSTLGSASVKVLLDEEAKQTKSSNKYIPEEYTTDNELDFISIGIELISPYENASGYSVGFLQENILLQPGSLENLYEAMPPLRESDKEGRYRVYGAVDQYNKITLFNDLYEEIASADFVNMSAASTDLVMEGAYIDNNNFAHMQLYSRTGSVIEWIRPLTEDTLYVGEWDLTTQQFIPKYKRYYGKEYGDTSWFSQHAQGDNTDEIIKYAFASLIETKSPTSNYEPEEAIVEEDPEQEGRYVKPPSKYISVLGDSFISATNEFFLDPSRIGITTDFNVATGKDTVPPNNTDEPNSDAAPTDTEQGEPSDTTDPSDTSDNSEPYAHYIGDDGEVIFQRFTAEDRNPYIKGRIQIQYAYNREGTYVPISDEDIKGMKPKDFQGIVAYIVLKDETPDMTDNKVISSAIPLEEEAGNFDEAWVEKQDETNKSHYRGLDISTGYVWSFQFYTTRFLKEMPEYIEFYSDWGCNNLINSFKIENNEAQKVEEIHDVQIKLQGYTSKDAVWMKFGDCTWKIK